MTEWTKLGRSNPELLRKTLEEHVREHGGCTLKAARALELSRPFFWYLLKKHGLNNLPAQVRRERVESYRFPTLEEIAKANENDSAA